MKTIARLFTVLLLAGVPAAALDAEAWLAKMGEIYQRAPFSMRYRMDMDMEQQGQSMSMTASADMLYRDQTHTRMSMKMSIEVPGAPQAKEMSVKSVMDGETLWSEVHNPMMGGVQVVKVAIADAEKMAASAGVQGLMSNNGVDPLSQIRAMQTMMTFEVLEQDAHTVVLQGTPTEKMTDLIGPQGAGFLAGGLRLVLEAETGAPRALSFGPVEAPTIRITFEDPSYLDDSDAPLESFVYTPPPGSTVTEPLAGALN